MSSFYFLVGFVLSSVSSCFLIVLELGLLGLGVDGVGRGVKLARPAAALAIGLAEPHVALVVAKELLALEVPRVGESVVLVVERGNRLLLRDLLSGLLALRSCRRLRSGFRGGRLLLLAEGLFLLAEGLRLLVLSLLKGRGLLLCQLLRLGLLGRRRLLDLGSLEHDLDLGHGAGRRRGHLRLSAELLGRSERGRQRGRRLELQVEVLASALARLAVPTDLGQRHGLLVVHRLARRLEHVLAVNQHGRRHRLRLALYFEGLPAKLVGVVKGGVHPGARLDQLRRDASLGHAALLLLGLLRSLGDGFHSLLGFGGGGGDDDKELLSGEALELLSDVLDVRHCVDCVDCLFGCAGLVSL